MRNENGFSLIELMIVVAIILIIAAIAVPNLLRSKMAANEASAGASLRTIATSNTTYAASYNIGFAGTLAQLGPTSGTCSSVSSDCADLIDSVLSGVNPALANPVKSGYAFSYAAPSTTPTEATQNATYSVMATPVGPGLSGTTTFCTDQTSMVRRDPAGGTSGPSSTGCGTFVGGPYY